MPTLSIAHKIYVAPWNHTRGSFAVDALIALALVVLVVFALMALVTLLGSADPSPAMAAAADGGMLILPP